MDGFSEIRRRKRIAKLVKTLFVLREKFYIAENMSFKKNSHSRQLGAYVFLAQALHTKYKKPHKEGTQAHGIRPGLPGRAPGHLRRRRLRESMDGARKRSAPEPLGPPCEGNHEAGRFAIACGWIGELEQRRHDHEKKDIHLVRDYRPAGPGLVGSEVRGVLDVFAR
jgi:hypothetical protein